jgi:hypothetical protein
VCVCVCGVFDSDAQVVSAAFHKASNLLVVGLSNGVFSLYDLPDFIRIHSLVRALCHPRASLPSPPRADSRVRRAYRRRR